MITVEDVHARQVLDSRGNPTVECTVTLDDGARGRIIVPSGASTGEHEAHELRDGGEAWLGRGVGTAVENINTEIADELKGERAEQRPVDEQLIELDGTAKKSRLGANAILGVSGALAWALADSRETPLWRTLANSRGFDPELPVPTLNLLNGGSHADNSVDVQEFMVAPAGFPSYSRALRAASEIYHTLKALLAERNYRTNVGDEGGFAPQLDSNTGAMEVLSEAVDRAGYDLGGDVHLCLDAAASEFFRGGEYVLEGEGRSLAPEALTGLWRNWVERFPLVSIEDGLDEDDWEGWKQLTDALGDRAMLVGDDLFATNPERLQRGIDSGVANAILIKLNQIGTVSETLDTIELAGDNGYNAVVSHRSGDSEDTTIAHLAVGTGCGLIKTGAPARSERTAKYNELLRIEDNHPGLDYAGTSAFPGLS